MIERPINDWLPATTQKAKKRGFDEIGVILISGHTNTHRPAFGGAVMGQITKNEKLSGVVVIQPNWQPILIDCKESGCSQYFFGIIARYINPMANHHTANKRLHSSDFFTTSNEAVLWLDYAMTECSNKLIKKNLSRYNYVGKQHRSIIVWCCLLHQVIDNMTHSPPQKMANHLEFN